MTLNWLLAWWNAIYTLPLAVVFVFLSVTSVISLAGGAFGEASDQEAEVDADHDVDVEHDVDVDHDADLDHDADTAPHVIGDFDGDGDHDFHDVFTGALVALGAGRMPLVMLLQVLLLFWGLTGTLLHQAAGAAGPAALLWSVPVSLVVSAVGTRGIAQAFGRFLRKVETRAVAQSGIVGRSGRVVYAVTPDEGTVSVRDEHGTLHRVRARTEQGRLDSGQEIVIIGYDPSTRLYEVDDRKAFLERA